jgi:hypothetical protein
MLLQHLLEIPASMAGGKVGDLLGSALRQHLHYPTQPLINKTLIEYQSKAKRDPL